MSVTDWMPRIDRNACIGCKDCIVACPTEALTQVDGKATLAYAERCIYCLACEDIWPSGAIELPFLIIKKERLERET